MIGYVIAVAAVVDAFAAGVVLGRKTTTKTVPAVPIAATVGADTAKAVYAAEAVVAPVQAEEQPLVEAVKTEAEALDLKIKALLDAKVKPAK